MGYLQSGNRKLDLTILESHQYKGIMKRLNAKNVRMLVYEPLIKEKDFLARKY